MIKVTNKNDWLFNLQSIRFGREKIFSGLREQLIDNPAIRHAKHFARDRVPLQKRLQIRFSSTFRFSGSRNFNFENIWRYEWDSLPHLLLHRSAG